MAVTNRQFNEATLTSRSFGAIVFIARWLAPSRDEVQNLGAVESYIKRYLYQNCFDAEPDSCRHEPQRKAEEAAERSSAEAGTTEQKAQNLCLRQQETKETFAIRLVENPKEVRQAKEIADTIKKEGTEQWLNPKLNLFPK